jgi:Flp pilus assembly protein TadD
MEYFKQAIDSESSNTVALGNLGSIYLKYEDYQKAVAVLKKAHGYDRSNLAIANNYAIALVGTKDFGRAFEIYENLANAKNASVQFNLALLTAEHKQDFAKARDLLNKVRFLTTDPAILKKANDVTKWLETRSKR